MNWEIILNTLPKFFEGLQMTLLLSTVAIGVGFVLAWPLALGKLSSKAYLRLPAASFIYFFRGTPLILQLFLVYYGLGQFSRELRDLGLWWFFRDELYCALLVLSLNASAYAAEIFRGGLQTIPLGEVEAARALGLTKRQRFFALLAPRALRISWPAYTNECVFMMQATSLVSLITVTDLFRVASQVAQRSFAIYEMYLSVALIYLAISYAIILGCGLIEQRLNRWQRFEPRRASLADKTGLRALVR